MPSRAELFAQPAFFPRRFVHAHRVFAEMPVGENDAHGILFDPEKNSLFCTCPFFPKPCWHAQALAALFARDGEPVFETVDELPEWVVALASGKPARVNTTAASPAQREAARNQRHFERLERAERGFEDLDAWLHDTLRRGVATAISEDPAFYQNIAARLADASMRGLSRNIRLLETISTAAPDWSDRVLAVLADAALALRAFRRRGQLPEALLHDLEAFIGISIKKETVLAQGAFIRDVWAVTGRTEEWVEAKLRVRRTWLLGARSQRHALLLDYAHGDLGFPPGFIPGALLEGNLGFYPSAWPQRALVPDTLHTLPKKLEKLPGFETIDAMTAEYAKALGTQPWLTHFPAVLTEVIPCNRKDHFDLTDAAGKILPLNNTRSAAWSILALSGGRPMTLFGEWDGAVFRVLSALAQHRVVLFDESL